MRGHNSLISWPTRAVRLALTLCAAATLLAFVTVPAGGRLLAGAAAQADKVQRDWTKHPAIVQLDTKADVYAIGDVHGDYDRLVALLTAAKVIAGPPKHPKEVQWRAGDAVLVCTGDLIDKGRHSLKVIALFRALQKRAADAGGRVIVLMGNHEAEFLADPDDDDKALHFLKELDRHGIDPKQVAAGEDPHGIGKYLRSLPLAARVNDWFFSHAGDTGGRTLKELQAALEKEVSAKGFDADILLGKKGLLEARLHKRPWWEKKGDRPADSEARLRGLARALGVKHLVIGHQPGNVRFSDGGRRKKGTLYQKFDGLIFLIDVGMSEAINYSDGAMLRIRGGDNPRVTALYPKKDPEPLWP